MQLNYKAIALLTGVVLASPAHGFDKKSTGPFSPTFESTAKPAVAAKPAVDPGFDDADMATTSKNKGKKKAAKKDAKPLTASTPKTAPAPAKPSAPEKEEFVAAEPAPEVVLPPVAVKNRAASPAYRPTPQSTLPNVAVDDDFILYPGDVLQITVWKEDGMDREVVVLADGTITFPLIGTLKAQGLSPSRLQATLKRALSQYIPESSITVVVKAPLGHSVSVLGQVAKPGEVIINRNMSVLEALSQVGGLTPYAKSSHLNILRYENGARKTYDFPYDAISQGRQLEKDIPLQPGDVIVVPTAGLF